MKKMVLLYHYINICQRLKNSFHIKNAHIFMSVFLFVEKKTIIKYNKKIGTMIGQYKNNNKNIY